MEAKRDTVKLKAKIKLLPTSILSAVSDILWTIGCLPALSQGQLMFKLGVIKYTMTKYIKVLIYFGRICKLYGVA